MQRDFRFHQTVFYGKNSQVNGRNLTQIPPEAAEWCSRTSKQEYVLKSFDLSLWARFFHIVPRLFY